MWVVKFRPDFGNGEPLRIYAEDVDLMSPPYVYIRGIRTKYKSDVIIIPEDEVYQELVNCDPLIITQINLVYAGELQPHNNTNQVFRIRRDNGIRDY